MLEVLIFMFQNYLGTQPQVNAVWDSKVSKWMGSKPMESNTVMVSEGVLVRLGSDPFGLVFTALIKSVLSRNSLKISSVDSTNLAPCLINWWQPLATGE